MAKESCFFFFFIAVCAGGGDESPRRMACCQFGMQTASRFFSFFLSCVSLYVCVYICIVAADNVAPLVAYAERWRKGGDPCYFLPLNVDNWGARGGGGWKWRAAMQRIPHGTGDKRDTQKIPRKRNCLKLDVKHL
jgi:hypothetical protein